MEHAGVYGKLLISKLTEKQTHFCVEMGYQIQRSPGLQRGRSDRVDALRIANYAAKNASELKAYEPTADILEQAKVLMKIQEQSIGNLQLKVDLILDWVSSDSFEDLKPQASYER